METRGELYCGQDDVIHISPRCEEIKRRALVEVFSVRVIVKPSDELEHIRGLILLKGSDQNYVIYEDPCDERGPQFDSEGQLILSGPECGVEVDFAVYGDGVEARLEVFLSDLKFDEGLLQSGNAVEIYGMIKASNSALIHPEAKSVLFHHMTSRECIKLSNWPPGEAEIRVPLTRNVMVIPRESALIVDVCLSLSCSPQNAPIAVGSAVFDARRGSNCTVKDQIIHGGHARVKVRVTWSI